MNEAENIDVDLYDTREEAVQAALDTSEPGDRIVICRGDWAGCPAGRMDSCEFCARIPWRPGLTVAAVLAQARPNT